MHIRIGYELIYDCPQPTPMLLMLTRPPRRGRRIWWCRTGSPPTRRSRSTPTTTASAIGAAGSSRPAGRTRLFAERGGQRHRRARPRGRSTRFSTSFPTCPTTRWCSCSAAAIARPIGWPTSPGRCSARRRSAGAASQAICDFVHDHITFGYEHARNSRTAWEGYCDRTGVCRDFAHLAVTFCRCMNIPARYCTGYLGDIGVPPDPAPMDFSAWFEVYLGGAWHTVDARHNSRASAGC